MKIADIEREAVTCGYTVISEIGAGAEGMVFKVRDNQMGEIFAYKYLETPGIKIIRNLREVDNMSRLLHPHISHASKLITSEMCNITGLAIVMPSFYIDFNQLINYKILVVPGNMIKILFQLLRAVEFLHENNIVHDDIHYGNIMFKGDATKLGSPCLIDLGQANITFDDTMLRSDMLNLRNIMINFFGGIGLSDDRKIFTAMPAEYQDKCNDFFNEMNRYKFHGYKMYIEKLSDHSIFDKIRYPITGFLLETPIPVNNNPNYYTTRTMISDMMLATLSDKAAVHLFAAIDLYNRVGDIFDISTIEKIQEIAVTCIVIATRVPWTNRSTQKILEIYPQISRPIISNYILKIIRYLSGILYNNKIYEVCINGDELRFCYKNILMSADPTLYSTVDIPALQVMMGTMFPTLPPLSQYPTKNITIAQLLQ